MVGASLARTLVLVGGEKHGSWKMETSSLSPGGGATSPES